MYTNIEDIQALVSFSLSNFIYITTFLDAATAIAAGILRGLRKSEWGAIGAIIFLFVSVPLQAMLCFYYGLGSTGLWIGITIGTAASTFFY